MVGAQGRPPSSARGHATLACHCKRAQKASSTWMNSKNSSGVGMAGLGMVGHDAKCKRGASGAPLYLES